MYKKLSLYIKLYIKKQHVFLLRDDDLYSIYTYSNQIEFDQEFLLFFKSLNKLCIQYCIIDLSL